MARAKTAKERLSGVILSDKISAIESMLRVLKNEQYKLLTNYMYLNERNLKVYIDLTEKGEYILNIRAVTDKLIEVGKILP